MSHIRTTLHALAAAAIIAGACPATAQTVQSLPTPPAQVPATDFNRPIAGPFTLQLKDPAMLDLGITLEKGRKYTLVVQGVGGTRNDYAPGTDPVYRFQDRGLKPGNVRPFNLLRLPAPNETFFDTVKKNQGVPPQYNPLHIYHVTVTGDGKPLKAWLKEANTRNYTDNSGAFVITVFNAPLSTIDPPGKAPLVDADVGG